MGRKLIAEGDSFKIEFETEGSGSYWAECLGMWKGPFASKEAARRWVMGRQERYLDTGNADNEDDVALRKAMEEAEQRTAEQEAAAQAGNPDWRDVGRTNVQDEDDEAELNAVKEIQRQRREAEAQAEAQQQQGDPRTAVDPADYNKTPEEAKQAAEEIQQQEQQQQ